MRSAGPLALAVALASMGCGSSNDSPGSTTNPSSDGGVLHGAGGGPGTGGALPGGGGGGLGGSTAAGGASGGGSPDAGPGPSTGGGGGGSTAAGGSGSACCADRDCQPASVRTCVCTDWQQDQCCTGTWDTFCQVTAEEKCQAEPCAGADAGAPSTDACCAEKATPGCSNSALESCICALLPDCCTTAWDAVCVQLVQEKHCESGVRPCVCQDWQQPSCCDTQWTSFCEITAEQKCGATAGCG